jgi:hypothetical protein
MFLLALHRGAAPGHALGRRGRRDVAVQIEFEKQMWKPGNHVRRKALTRQRLLISALIFARVETMRYQKLQNRLRSTCTFPNKPHRVVELLLRHFLDATQQVPQGALHHRQGVAVQAAFERHVLKPDFQLLGVRVETTWVPGAFQRWVRGSQLNVQRPARLSPACEPPG